MKRKRLDRHRAENNRYSNTVVNRKKQTCRKSWAKPCLLVLTTCLLIGSSVTTYYLNVSEIVLQAMEVNLPSTIVSKRKLVHVINPYVDVAMKEHSEETSEFIDTKTKERKPAMQHKSEHFPMSNEQMTILLSIKRSREVFEEYAASVKEAYNQTNHATSKSDEIGMDSAAMALFAFHHVELVCAVLTKDINWLENILKSICDRVVLLSRSTSTEFGTNRSLPFLRDILKSSQIDRNELPFKSDDNFYLFSNADIGLSKYFYVHLDMQVRERQASALSINRMTLDMETKGSKSLETMIQPSGFKSTDTSSEMDEAWRTASRYLSQADDLIVKKQFQLHPGYDCFLFHSSVLRRIHFGDFFVGFPPFGANVHLALQIMAPNYVNLASNPNGTFHLGNDRDWQILDADPNIVTNSTDQSKQQSVTHSDEFWAKFQGDLHYLEWCPISNHPPPNEYAMQNSINCGKWFHPNRHWAGNNYRKTFWFFLWPWQTRKTAIPAFVREGSEAIYIQNFAKYLNYTAEGMPIVPGHQTPEIKRRRPKIVNRARKEHGNKGDVISFLLNQLLKTTITSFSR